MKGFSEENINGLKKFVSSIFRESESFKYLEIGEESSKELIKVKIFINQDYLAVDRLLDNTIKQSIIRSNKTVVDAGSNGLPSNFPSGTLDFNFSVYDAITREKIEDFFQKYS